MYACTNDITWPDVRLYQWYHLPDSQSFYYPEHVGLSIGEHDSPKIAVLEIHYDNYESKAGNFRMRTICHWVRQFQAPHPTGHL